MLALHALCICRKNKSVVSSDLALVSMDQVDLESPYSVASNALVPLDQHTGAKELNMINLLSLTLCRPTPRSSTNSPTQSQNGPQQPTILLLLIGEPIELRCMVKNPRNYLTITNWRLLLSLHVNPPRILGGYSKINRKS